MPLPLTPPLPSSVSPPCPRTPTPHMLRSLNLLRLKTDGSCARETAAAPGLATTRMERARASIIESVTTAPCPTVPRCSAIAARSAPQKCVLLAKAGFSWTRREGGGSVFRAKSTTRAAQGLEKKNKRFLVLPLSWIGEFRDFGIARPRFGVGTNCWTVLWQLNRQ